MQHISTQVAVQSVQDREAQLRSVLNTVVDGVIVMTGLGVIKTVNPAVEQLFSYSEGELTGRHINMLIPEFDKMEHTQYLKQYLPGEENDIIATGREVEGWRNDGTIFPIEVSVCEIDTKGERMFTCIVHDITELKKVERMKTEFVSMVSHELRTPLTSYSRSLRPGVGKCHRRARGEDPEITGTGKPKQ